MKGHGASVVVGLLKVAFAAAIFWLVLRKVDFSSAWAMAAKQDYGLVLVAYAICFLQIGLGGIRWLTALRALGARPPVGETLRFFYVSLFFNAWVPGGVGGDMMRAWLSYRANISAKVAVTSVILDRLAVVVSIAILILITMPSYLGKVGFNLIGILPIALSMTGLAGLVLLTYFRKLPETWLTFRVLRALRDFGLDVRTVFLRPRNAFPLILIAMVSQTALGAATYAMAASLDIEISLVECIVLMQPVALVSNLPITVGGWGVREAAMIYIFALVGVPAAVSLALSVQLGLLLLAIALPGGLLWLFMKPTPMRAALATGPGNSASSAPVQRIV